MTTRLYCLLPDVDTADTAVSRLKEAGLSNDQIGVVARDEIAIHDLPEPDVTETSDLIGSAERGAVAGGITGTLAGLTAMVFPPAGLAVGGGLVVATGLAGTGFGAWASSMIGIRHNSSQVEEYEQAIQNGQVLMMVDVDSDRVADIKSTIKQAHPDARIEHAESS